MLRVLDILLSALGLFVATPVILLLVVAGYFDTGSPIFRQERVGRNGLSFVLVKFRTMRVGTASTASHLANSGDITAFGRFLRRTKLDELPQLWNVLKGEMSLVGPRPCLPSQLELIEERKARGVLSVRPGITGLAQVGGVDMSVPERLAEIDAKMLEDLTLSVYLKLLVQTLCGKGQGDRVV